MQFTIWKKNTFGENRFSTFFCVTHWSHVINVVKRNSSVPLVGLKWWVCSSSIFGEISIEALRRINDTLKWFWSSQRCWPILLPFTGKSEKKERIGDKREVCAWCEGRQWSNTTMHDFLLAWWDHQSWHITITVRTKQSYDDEKHHGQRSCWMWKWTERCKGHWSPFQCHLRHDNCTIWTRWWIKLHPTLVASNKWESHEQTFWPLIKWPGWEGLTRLQRDSEWKDQTQGTWLVSKCFSEP